MSAVAAKTAVAPSRRSWWKRSQNTRTAYLFLLPAMLVMAVITFYPLVFQVFMSFTDYSLSNFRGKPPTIVGIDNYTQILNGNIVLPNFDFLHVLTFNLFWAFTNVVIHVVLGVIIAVVLNQQGLRLARLYRAIFILPVAIPPIIVAAVWRDMYDPHNGAINYLLGGITGIFFKMPPIDWLNFPYNIFQVGPLILPLSYFALLVANIWLGWPLNSVVATGALQSIPGDLYEAAEMDGANSWQKFRYITIPFLRPAMLPYAIYGFIITFNLFYLSYFMSGGGPFGETELLVTIDFRLVNEQHLFGVAAAFAVFQFFILLVLTIATNRLAKTTADISG
jgi:arabinogalactan oligomer / maltooligosaccharide transport system permease protein